MNKIFSKEDNNEVSPLKNPFKQQHIKSIYLSYERVMFEKHFAWEARVRFSNDDTEGTQKFKVTDLESDTAFQDITLKVQTFINSL